MQFLITAIVAVILFVGVVSSCPSVCSCTSNGVNVNCSRRGLDSIPTDLPNNTYDLQIQYNKISVIENNTFNNLPDLRYLELQYNDISVIENNAFNNLPDLCYLYLHSNKITSIKSDMFNNLTNLYRLELQHNGISVIENKAFNNLPDLHYLCLHSNKITSIKSDMFNNLTKLYQLELQYNDISVIENNALSNLPDLHYLYLHSNKITSIKSDMFNNLTKLDQLFMGNNPILFVSEHAFENLPNLTSLGFDMYCGGCDNVPFWRWLKLNQKFSTSITCHDFDREYLSNLQLSNVTDCFGQYPISPTSSNQSGLLTAGIACSILLSIIFVVSFVVYRRFRLKKGKTVTVQISRIIFGNTENNTCNPRPVVTDQYDILNTTNMDVVSVVYPEKKKE